MQFRLTYRGNLRSGNTKDRKHIHQVRGHFHRQLVRLWQQKPLSEYQRWLQPATASGDYSAAYDVAGKRFIAIAGSGTNLLVELGILFLRPALPGALIRHGGDIDNRVKTLLDSLRIPSPTELPRDWLPTEHENPFHCLMEDDKLVTAFSVTTDRLLDFTDPEHDAMVVIHVKLTSVMVTLGISGLVG